MKLNKVFTVGLILTIILTGAFAAEAMSPGRHHHGVSWKTLLKLGLSDTQQSQILGIYGKYDTKSLMRNFRQARRNLRTALSQATSEDSIDGIVSAYLTTVAPLQQQLLSTRAKMMYEIKAVLTPAQLQQLELLRSGR